MASSTDRIFLLFGGCLLRARTSSRWHLLESQNDPARHFRSCKESKWQHSRQLGISAKSVNHFDPLVYGDACTPALFGFRSRPGLARLPIRRDLIRACLDPHADGNFIVLRCDITQSATHARWRAEMSNAFEITFERLARVMCGAALNAFLSSAPRPGASSAAPALRPVRATARSVRASERTPPPRATRSLHRSAR